MSVSVLHKNHPGAEDPIALEGHKSVDSPFHLGFSGVTSLLKGQIERETLWKPAGELWLFEMTS